MQTLGGTHLEQDMFISAKKGAARKAYLNAIQVAVNNRETQYLVLAKGHHTRTIRSEVVDTVLRLQIPGQLIQVLYNGVCSTT